MLKYLYMVTKKIPYVHKLTGNVKILTKQGAKKLDANWDKVEFTTNDQGKRVMRIQLNGATVDISENEPEEVSSNGNGNTK